MSDSQSKRAFVSTERGPFNNVIGMTCKKLWLFTAASISFGGSDVSVLWMSVAC